MKNLKIKFGLFSLLAILAVSVFLTSCEQESLTSLDEDSIDSSISLKAKEQLDLSVLNWNQHFGYSVKAIGYEVLEEVNSASKIEAITNDIVAASNYIPQGDFHNPSSVTVAKIQDVTDTEITSRINNIVVDKIQLGQTEVKVKWELNGEPFYSTAIVDKNGIVYDNMIFNTVIVENMDEPILEYTDVPQGEAPTMDRAWQYKGWTWTIWRANWLWGSERGKGWVTAGVWCWDGTRYSQYDSFSYDGYFSGGSEETEAKKLNHECNKFKYVYGWVTATGSVSYNANNFTVSVSGLGSKGNGGGQGGACCWGTI